MSLDEAQKKEIETIKICDRDLMRVRHRNTHKHTLLYYEIGSIFIIAQQIKNMKEDKQAWAK